MILSPARKLGLSLLFWASGFALCATSACRKISPSPEKLVIYRKAVLIAVEKSSRVPVMGWNRFTISARSLRPLIGKSVVARFQFDATLSSDGCGIAPLPPKGEKWVIFLSNPADNNDQLALPLALVRELDERFAAVQ